MPNYPMYGQPYHPYNPPQYQPQYQQPQQPAGLNGRMVTSKEEALGVPVDFMGGVTILPDLGHGRIYTKVFNPQSGSADFVEYVAAKPQMEAAPNDLEQLKARVDELARELAAMKEGANG